MAKTAEDIGKEKAVKPKKANLEPIASAGEGAVKKVKKAKKSDEGPGANGTAGSGAGWEKQPEKVKKTGAAPAVGNIGGSAQKNEAGEKLVRVEVICSQAMDEDFAAHCSAAGVAKMFTKVPSVMGQGFSVPKMGDSVWPQMNTLYIIYCKKAEAARIYEIVQKLQGLYPGEGCAFFQSKAKII